MNTSVDLSWTGVWAEDILGFHFFISLHPVGPLLDAAGTAPHTPPSDWSLQGEVWKSEFHSMDRRPKSSQSENKYNQKEWGENMINITKHGNTIVRFNEVKEYN